MNNKNKKRTILFVSHSADLYGAERVLCFLIGRLQSVYDLHIAVPGDGLLADHIAKLPGVSLHRLALPSFTKNPLVLIRSLPSFVTYFFELRALLRFIKPDLVYGNTIRNYITCLFAQRLGYRNVIHIHEKNAGHPAGSLIANIIGASAEKVIYVSEYARRTFEDRSTKLSSKGVTIYNGVLPGRGAALRTSLSKSEDEHVPVEYFPILATASNLAPHKHLDDLVDAMKTLVGKYPDALMLIAGEGSYRKQLEANIKGRGLQDSVILKGYVDAMDSFLDAADIVICPFEDEGFGLVALEAMARGKALIAAFSGALPEIVTDEETGLFYPVGDIRGLVEKIIQLAGSPDLRARLGLNGSLRASQVFSADRQAAQIREIIDEALVPLL